MAIADKEGRVFWGVGLHDDIVFASVNALVSAINRMIAKNKEKEDN